MRRPLPARQRMPLAGRGRQETHRLMSTQKIAPALAPQEWRERRCGAVSVCHVESEVHVVVRDPDDQLVSVSAPEELFALIALANDALPHDDPRKITLEKVRTLEAIATDMW